MSAETEPAGAARAPGRLLRWIDIPVREPDGQPSAARPRFAWNMGEVSGSLGDLGTFLPHIVGAITVVKMDPTGILTTFGLFYAFTGAFYGVPMAVQPMKAASAAVLIEPMAPAAIAGAGLVIGAFFLVLGLTGVVSRLARALPGSIAAGLQLGLGLSLAALGIRLIGTQIWLGVAISALILGLMRYQRSPVALVAVLAGIAVGQVLGITPPFPMPDLGLHLPHIVVPTWAHCPRHRIRCPAADPIDSDQRDHRHGGGIAAAIPEGAASGQRAESCDYDRPGQPTVRAVRGLSDVPWGRRHRWPLPVRRSAGHSASNDRPDLRCTRDRVRRERVRDAQDDPGCRFGWAVAVLRHRTCAIRDAARAPGRRLVLGPVDGCHRGRAQPGRSVRGWPPDCLRI